MRQPSIADPMRRGFLFRITSPSATTVAIVFNGEIYNFKELRAELHDYPYRSASDTEVILAAYKRYGIDCVKKFNGIFAFAIYDMRTGDIFLARDHMGVKPLHYYFDGERLIFSSEIKAILAHKVPRAVDREALNLYLHLLYIPEPYTMFSGIKKFPAGCYARLSGGKFSITRYWEVSDFSDLQSRDEARGKIRALFDDAVKRQLISDRPVGVFLSGGIDSTAILGSVRASGAPVTKTYSVGFDVAVQTEKFNSDFLFARQTAKYYGTEHHELVVGPKDIRDNMMAITEHLDEPNFNPTAGAIFLLAKLAKKEVAVVLGGDGGDELFGGYPRYYASRIIGAYQRIPAILRLPVEGVAAMLGKRELLAKMRARTPAERMLALFAVKEATVREVSATGISNPGAVLGFTAEHYFGTGPDYSTDFEKHFMNADRRGWLRDESLMRSDKMTMAHGLEQRVPILDYRLVELTNKIPTQWKLHLRGNSVAHFQGKDIWREAVADYLPPHLRTAPKRGWFTPMAKWVRSELKDFVSDVLSPANLPRDFFDAEGVARMWRDHLSGARYNLNMIWAIVSFTLWHERFIRRK
ncbi:MAG: asparagine synthase (glutamine-hydrolyzing) [Candidatus Harrisonbacteria bacterium]|nr:asparagine synthase (glutamine-hydrolyzing) [Candidatus Harrisonbacteria bacterium]